jgi:DHA3 family tetracycline resistance protein-like MFS transporter
MLRSNAVVSPIRLGEGAGGSYDDAVLRFVNGKLNPVAAYLLLACGDAFFFTMVMSVSILFQTTEAGLGPFQLLLVGAALQGAILVSEVPTGIVADTYSRRLSVLVGLLLLGSGSIVSGIEPEFWSIVVGTVILGIGRTFISGALQAWIADEVGVEQANGVYLRGAQATMVFWVAAIPASFGLAAVADINVPILIGGVWLIALAVLMVPLMPETGFQRPNRDEAARGFRDLANTLSTSRRLVRGRPLLLTMFTITAFYGIAGQGFERLWVAHFYDNIGFPAFGDVSDVVWFGVIRVAAAVLGVIALDFVRRTQANRMTSHEAVSRALFRITAVQMTGILVLAVASSFEVAAAAYCVIFALSFAYDPLYLAWINQNVDSSVRATVISMSSQTDALGRTLGGPVIGVVGSMASLRAALAVAGLVLVPALLFYFRAFGQGTGAPIEDSAKVSS